MQFRWQPSLPYGAVVQHSHTPHHFICALKALQRRLMKPLAKVVDILKSDACERMLATLKIIAVITNFRDVLTKAQTEGFI